MNNNLIKDGIYLDGSDILKQVSVKVSPSGLTVEENAALQLLYLQMCKKNKAQGISAIQLGCPSRICTVRLENRVHVMINPKMVFKFWWQYSNEGCYSTREKRYWVWRPFVGIVFYYDAELKPHFMRLNKNTVRVVCHEIDHMNGLLISRGKEYRAKNAG